MVRSRAGMLFRLTAANVRRHRTRWVLTTFGVAIGVASFTGVLALSRSVMSSFENSVVVTAGKAQLQVSNGSAGVDAALIDEVARVPDVEVASGTVQYRVVLPALGRRLTIFGVLFGAEQSYREVQFGGEVLDLPDSAKFLYEPDSIALPRRLLDQQGWTLGSTVEVIGPKGPEKLTVRGTVRDEGALRIFGGDLGVMDSDGAQHAFGQLDRFHWVDVVVRPGADLEAVRAALTSVVANRGVVDTPFGRGRRMEAMLATLRWMLTMSGVVAMLVGVFLIQHTIATAVRQRRADLTRLRVLGARRSLLMAYLFGEALAVGLAGSLLGIGLGIGLSMLASGLFSDSISTMYAPVPPPRLAVTGSECVAALALGLGTVLAAALLPMLTLFGRRPLEAPVSVEPGWRKPIPLAVVAGVAFVVGLACAYAASSLGFAGGVSAIAAFAGLTFLGTTCLVPAALSVLAPVLEPLLRRRWDLLGTWTWQQVRKRQLHTATTIGALAAGVTFTVGMTTVLGSYRGAAFDWFNQTFRADIFVNAGATMSLLAGPTLDLDLAQELRGLEGVTRVMPWRLLEVEFRGRPIIIQGMDEALIDQAHPDVKLDHAGGEVVISDTLAERYGLAVGDRIALPAPIAPLHVTVHAIAPDYALDLGNVKVGWDLFSKHFAERSANILAVDAAPGASSQALKHAIEKLSLGRYDVSVLTSDELRTIVGQVIDQSFALTYALQLLAILVTILAMVNATSAAILDRSAELQTWRALGLERWRLIGVLVTEAGILGLVACLLGLGAGSFVGATLVRIVAPAVVGFQFALRWSMGTAVLLILLVTVAASVSAWLVARKSVSQFVSEAENPA